MTNKSATASMPADMSVPAGPAGPRRKALHRLISERGFVAVAEIAREIGVSDMTVRRDLDARMAAAFLLDSWEGAVLRSKVDRNASALEAFEKVAFTALLS